MFPRGKLGYGKEGEGLKKSEERPRDNAQG